MTKKPVVLVIMDGVGKGDGGPGDAVKLANTPNLDRLFATCPHNWLKAHGTAVGLPTDDDMGNSEVGHNALGCGQIYSQGAKLVGESIETGALFQSETWKAPRSRTATRTGKAFHFLGLLSDGNVHSQHPSSLRPAAPCAWPRASSAPTATSCSTAATCLPRPRWSMSRSSRTLLRELNTEGCDYAIASGGGRMQITMDRYEANWPMVEAGLAHACAGPGPAVSRPRRRPSKPTAPRRTASTRICPPLSWSVTARPWRPSPTATASCCITSAATARRRSPSRSTGKDFDKFDRGDYTGVDFAGMLEYDGDLKIPTHYLVQPPVIRNTLTELLCAHNLREYAVSETQKYGHVTYFWNGNRSGKVSEELETYEEIPSDVIPFDQAPAMKSKEITDCMVAAMESGKYDFLRCNFPNGDMVGHTGNIEAVVKAMEYVDEGVGRIIEAGKRLGYVVLVTADHGNADQMLETKKGKTSIRTAHSLNPVPFIVVDPGVEHTLKEGKFGLANVAPTVATLLGLTPPALLGREHAV